MAKGRSTTKPTKAKRKDKIAAAVFIGLVVIGIVAIVAAVLTSTNNASTSDGGDSKTSASTTADSSQNAAADAGSTEATPTTPPPLNRLAEPTGELQIIDISIGSGKAAEVGDTLEIHYTGYFEDGNVLDSSLPRETPFPVTLGAGKVITGWEQGLVGMQVGGKRQLIIPPDLAYGDKDYSSIPGGSTLIFDIELMAIS
jgi:peptidylprolyl isomerase